MDKEKFIRLMSAYAQIQPWRAPDFSKPEVAWYYMQDLKVYDLETIKHAIDKHIHKSDHFPSLREIHNLAGKNAVDDQTRASIITMNLIGAVRKFGYNNHKEAMAYIGPEGEKVVTLMGGWSHFCDSLTDQNISYMQNIIKEYASSLLKSNYDFTAALPSGGAKLLIEGLANGCEVSKKGAADTKRNTGLAVDKRIQGMEELLRTEIN